MTMGSRSFWRTYNLISALGCVAMGIAFIIGGFMIPVVRIGFIFGGIVCIGIGAMLAAWAHFSKDLIPDVPMMGPSATLDYIANANANAQAMQSAVMGMSPYPVQQVQQMVPGQAVVDRADDTGFGSAMGRTMDLHLTVTLAGRTPFQTMVREVVPLGYEAHVGPGQVLGVRGNPDNRNQLLVAIPGRP
jgi:hypothetical protein